MQAASDLELRRLATELRRRAATGDQVDAMLAEAYALVVEASVRTLGLRPYDVQMTAAVALHHRNVIEMQTGEGKTLAAVAPAFLNALTGKGVHILT